MPSIRFSSLPSEAFTVAVSQKGARAETTYDPTTGPPTPPPLTPPTGKEKVTITANRLSGTAPAGFFLSATTTGFTSSEPNFDPYCDLLYTWTFQEVDANGFDLHYTRHDTDDLPWGRIFLVDGKKVEHNGPGYPKGSNVTFLGNNKNIAWGPHVAHVFAPAAEDFDRAASKTYKVRCEVRSGPTAEPVTWNEEILTVDNPDAEFARSRTLCISTSGNTEGAPVGALHYQTFEEAVTANRTRKEPLRFLFRRGETHLSYANWGSTGPDFGKMQAGAYGSGTKPPKLIPGAANAAFDIRPRGGEASYTGIDFEGPYDPSDPYSVESQPFADGFRFDAKFKTIWDCKVSGFDKCIPGQSNLILGNTIVTDWWDYGAYFWDGASHVGLAGVWIKQHPQAVFGGARNEATAPLTTDHSPFRANVLGGPFAFNLVDVRAVGGWGGAVNGMTQPCLRLGKGVGNEVILNPPSEEANIDRLRGEGGNIYGTGSFYNSTEAKTKAGKPYYGPLPKKRYLYDKVYQVRSHDGGGTVIKLHVMGPVMRNGIVSLPNTPGYPAKVSNQRGVTEFIDASRTGVEGYPCDYTKEALDYGTQIYSMTFVDLRNDTNLEIAGKPAVISEGMYSVFPNILCENNVVHVPNASNGARAKIDDKSVLWDVKIKGVRYLGDPFLTLYGMPAETAMSFAPLTPVAGELKATSGKVAIDDFYGRLRSPSPTQGAVEPLG